jgi:hypothetical protein
MTPEKEKEIRNDVSVPGYLFTPEEVRELLVEIDRLRGENARWEELNEQNACIVDRRDVNELKEKLAVATEALKIVTMHDPYEYDDKTCAGFMTVVYDNAKKALSKIGGEKC